MKNIALALLASVILTANAEEIPQYEIKTVEVTNKNIIFNSRKTSWKVVHDCSLYLNHKSIVGIEPLGRSRKLTSSDSLIITVDGNKSICDIEHIEELAA